MDSFQSKTRISSTADHQSGVAKEHALSGWCIKVVCGFTLVALLGLKTIYGFNDMWPVPTWAAQTLVFVGVAIVFIHYRWLKQSNAVVESPTMLVSSKGLYHWVRHPMYLGDLVWYLGMTLLFFHPITVTVFAIASWAILKQAEAEDSFLASRFPDQFSVWRSNTKRLVPAVY